MANEESERSAAQNPTPQFRLEEESERSFVHKEGGWGWIVVTATGYCYGVLIGMMSAYALLYNGLVAQYRNISNHVLFIAWIGSLSVGVQYLFCFLASILIDLFSIRKIALAGSLLSTVALFACAFVKELRLYFLAYGVLFGVGQALLLTSTSAILSHYFKRKLALANGIMNFLGSLIVILMPILTSIFLSKYGLKETFFLLSALNFFTILFSFTYKSQMSNPNKSKRVSERIRSSFGIQIFKNKQFILWTATSFIAVFGYLIPIININHHSIKVFPAHEPVYNNIVFAGAAAVGSIVFGKVGDLTKFNRMLYHSFALLAHGIVALTIPYAKSPAVLLIQLAILGVLDGIYLAFIVPIAFDLASKSPILTNQAIGYFYVFICVPAVAGPAIAGKIYEINESYDRAFYFDAAFSMFGSLLQIFFLILFKFTNKKRNRER